MKHGWNVPQTTDPFMVDSHDVPKGFPPSKPPKNGGCSDGVHLVFPNFSSTFICTWWIIPRIVRKRIKPSCYFSGLTLQNPTKITGDILPTFHPLVTCYIAVVQIIICTRNPIKPPFSFGCPMVFHQVETPKACFFFFFVSF